MLPNRPAVALLAAGLVLLGAASAGANQLAGTGLAFPKPLPDHGDALELVGRLELGGQAPFDHDGFAYEYTWTLNGPVCYEVREAAPGILYRSLTFGVLEIREDPDRDSAFQIFPPNALVPSSFHDGGILLMGIVTDLEIREIFGIVTASAQLRFEAGRALGLLQNAEWSFNAAVSTYGAEIPNGYGSRWTLVLLPRQTVSVETSTWAGIKTLYR